MINEKDILIEFETDTNIVQMTAVKKIACGEESDLTMLCSTLHSELEKHAQRGRFVLIVNLGKIAIDPCLVPAYAEKAKSLTEKFLLPGGIARYGYEITRLTARQGYQEKLHEDPNLFATRGEAYAFARNLLAAHTNASSSVVG